MVLFVSLVAILSIVLLFSSCLAFAFGNYVWCDWADRAGWCGATTVVFIIICISITKTLEAVVPVILDKVSLWNQPPKTGSGEGLDIGRRRFLRCSLDMGLIAISGSLAVHGVSEGLSLPRVKEVDINIDNLPPDLEGLRIVQITDLHISSAIRRNYVENLVAQVNLLAPDIIAFTGDIADEAYTQIRCDAAPLAGLTARLGKFFVTGNHEYMHGVDEWMREMENMGFTVLMNDHRLIAPGRGRLLVGGVADYSAPSRSSHASSPAEAIGDGSTADVKILLAHQPKSVYEAARAGFDLQLSGHTHGGQLGPGRWLRSLGQPFQSGLYRYENTQIYVSNGAGYWGLPVRIGAPSEISRLRLVLPQKGEAGTKVSC